MGRSVLKPVRIGVYGGSFDPIHPGHLAVASHAVSELNLDKVFFVLSPRNPLKKGSRTLSEARRVALVKKAIRRQPRFAFSDIELKRKGPSYTVDTLRTFKRRFKSARLYFLAGADQMRGVSRWKSLDEVLKLSRFAVMTRTGHPFRTRDKRFLWLAMPPVDISSSQIRKEQNKGPKPSTPRKK